MGVTGRMSDPTSPGRGREPDRGRDGSGRRAASGSGSRLKRAALSVAGGVLVVDGVRRRSLPGAVLALAGAGLLARTFGATERVERIVEERTTVGGETLTGGGGSGRAEASRSITVDRPPGELHDRWRDPEALSEVVAPFATVVSAGDDRLRWTVDGPRGRTFTWETRVVEEEHGEVVRWETPPDATVPNEWSVEFRPASGDRGTVVTLAVRFAPPGGALGTAALERLDVVPESLVATALDRFKSLAESDEIPTLDRNPSGRGTGDLV